MMRVMMRMTRTATMSIWLNPFGREGIVIRHFEVDTPTAVLRYAVKLRATAAFDST